MGLWGWVKKKVTRKTKHSSPKTSSPSPTSSPKPTGKIIRTPARSSDGSSGGSTRREINLPAKKRGGVISTDYTTGEGTTTYYDSEGTVTQQTYSSGGGRRKKIGKAQALSTATRTGGTVSDETSKLKPVTQQSRNLETAPKTLGGVMITKQEAVNQGLKPEGNAQAYTIPADQIRQESKWERFKTGVDKVMYPFDTEETVWRSGRGIPREEFEGLSSSQKGAMFLTPENILLFAEFPRFQEPVTVKFAGVKEATKGGKDITYVQYKASTGETGGALGMGKTVGRKGNIQVTDTTVIGGSYRGKVADLTRGGKITYKNQQVFIGKQQGLYLKKGDQFVQVGAGKVGTGTQTGGTSYSYKGVDFGVTKGSVTSSFGGTVSGKDVAFSGGKIYDLNYIKGKLGSNIGSGSSIGGSGRATTKTIQQTATTITTQNIVRASIQPVAPISSSVPAVAKTVGAGASMWSSSTIQKQTPIPIQKIVTSTVQVPKEKELLKTITTNAIIPSTKSRGATKVSTITTTIPKVIPKVTPVLAPPILATPTLLTPKKYTPTAPTITPTTIPITKVPIPFIPPFALGSLNFGGRSKNVPLKQTFKYTPDYTSLIQGRRGAKGKSVFNTQKYAGFESRPITDSWTSMFTSAFGFKKKKKGGRK